MRKENIQMRKGIIQMCQVLGAQMLQDAGVSKCDIEYDAQKIKRDGNKLTGSVYVLFGDREPVTIGTCGENEIRFIMQVNVEYPKALADGILWDAVDTIENCLVEGEPLTYNKTTATIRKINVSSPIISGGLRKVAISINLDLRQRRKGE